MSEDETQREAPARELPSRCGPAAGPCHWAGGTGTPPRSCGGVGPFQQMPKGTRAPLCIDVVSHTGRC